MPEPVVMERADVSGDFINLFQLTRTVFRPNRRDIRLGRRLFHFRMATAFRPSSGPTALDKGGSPEYDLDVYFARYLQ